MNVYEKIVATVRRLKTHLLYLNPDDPYGIEFNQFLLFETLRSSNQIKTSSYRDYDEMYTILCRVTESCYINEITTGFSIFKNINGIDTNYRSWTIPKKMISIPFESLKIIKEKPLPLTIELFHFMKRIEDYEPSIALIIINYVVDFITFRRKKESALERYHTSARKIEFIYL